MREIGFQYVAEMEFRAVHFLILIFASIPSSSAAIVARLTGLDVFSYNLTAGTACDQIRLQFKTVASSGLLVFCSGTNGSSFKVEILDGELRVTVTLMPGHYTAATVGSKLNDNKWHYVKLDMLHPRNILAITLDNTKVDVPDRSLQALHLTNPLFLGGMQQSATSGVANFTGCLKNLCIGKPCVQILERAMRRKCQSCLEVARLPGGCMFHPTLLGFVTSRSSASYHSESNHNFVLYFNFRTYQQDGFLAFKVMDKSVMYLALKSGHLELNLTLHRQAPIVLFLGEGLNDGQWHKAMCSVSKVNLTFKLDHTKQPTLFDPRLRHLDAFKGSLIIGQAPEHYVWPGFVGCIRNVRVNGQHMHPHTIVGVASGVCVPINNCHPNPCLNGGTCIDGGHGFSCICAGTFHKGKKCEVPLYRGSCEEYGKQGLSEDAFCTLDLDGTGPVKPFEVLCNMTGTVPQTVIGHDRIGQQRVDQGIHVTGAFYHQLTYNVTQDVIRAVVNNSITCRQHVRYICMKSRLMSPGMISVVQWRPAQTQKHASPYANYWGGAPRESYMCQCGVNRTCDDPSEVCNCNVGDETWREDAGYITDKFSLPILGLLISEEGRQSYFSVGPLECFGLQAKQFGNTEDSKTGRDSSALYRICKLVSPEQSNLEWDMTHEQVKVTEPRPSLSDQASVALKNRQSWSLALYACVGTVAVSTLFSVVILKTFTRRYKKAKMLKGEQGKECGDKMHGQDKVEIGAYNVRSGKILFQYYKNTDA